MSAREVPIPRRAGAGVARSRPGARPGQITAVIGSTGAGKTTLLNLIPRLFDTTGGVVLVDGVDVRQLDLGLLARTVGLVPQRPYLFSGTVASNLRYGNPEATMSNSGERSTSPRRATSCRRWTRA